MKADSPLVPSVELPIDLNPLCARLEELSPGLQSVKDWPAVQIRLLADAGVLAWGLPPEFGGHPASDVQVMAAYEKLAAACLTTTFVLTQRNAACQRIAASSNFEIKSELLPSLCRGEAFATVGISHLTTSRQHLAKPVVTAVEAGDHFVLDGTVPWVTSASAAENIVTGGTLADGRQVLMAVPVALAGVERREPMQLLALSASRTATLVLDNVRVPKRNLLFGPIEQVMKHGGGGAGSLTTSTLAVGLTAGILGRLKNEAQRRTELVPILEALESEHRAARADLYLAANSSTAGAPSAESVRQKANSLVLRAAQAYLAASKGAGFVVGHPAERAVREAMFFLVWSCPAPVVSAALREFACVIDDA
ncbi:MAG TPA: acyl-CoA dehydrogenase family protein [Planctomycetaceae bacterium]|jgi:alkylation response protein AidB-like acyl-CoA dehydrogenase|nr:acyl-CoA dehydrogenase family protein [Planctomycetaceae bacterium]